MSVLMVIRNLFFLKIFSLTFFLLFVLSNPLYSSDKFIKAVKDTNYIESYPGQFGIYGYAINKYTNFEFKGPKLESSSFIHYKPNNSLNFGVGASYKWLGLALAYNFDFINGDDNLKGKTKSLDLQLNIYTRRILLDGYLMVYKGFFWNNTDDFIKGWSAKDSLYVRPDVLTVVLSQTGTYALNYDRLSIKAAYQYTERQKKTAGSFLVGYNISIYGVFADSSLIPHYFNDLNTDLYNVNRINSISLGASLGYTYTLVFKKYFFVNGFFMAGANCRSFTIYDQGKRELKNNFIISSGLRYRFSFGFNKPKTFYGLLYIGDAFLINGEDHSEFNYHYGNFRLYYGRRFKVGN